MIMSSNKNKSPKIISSNLYENQIELRRGPWTLDEDNLLIQYINCNGEGKWNSLAKYAGLNRTGKSCRLRWLNYLKPDIKRGNLSPHEQILILELHSKWGNRWSKIAQHLPGRTDNEIKNYWRTRVQKQARQLKIDSNSKKFLEAIRMFWMPRLLEKIEQNSSPTSSPCSSITTLETQNFTAPSSHDVFNQLAHLPNLPCPNSDSVVNNLDSELTTPLGDICNAKSSIEDDCYHVGISPSYDIQEFGCHVAGADWLEEDFGSAFWNTDELWQNF